MNLIVRLLVGWSDYHNFLERFQVPNTPTGALISFGSSIIPDRKYLQKKTNLFKIPIVYFLKTKGGDVNTCNICISLLCHNPKSSFIHRPVRCLVHQVDFQGSGEGEIGLLGGGGVPSLLRYQLELVDHAPRRDRGWR